MPALLFLRRALAPCTPAILERSGPILGGLRYQSSETTDHFARLGVSRQFLLDPKDLQASYRKLMVEFHPDKHVGRPAHKAAEEEAALITDAYQTLKAPHTRATHLLELLGRPLDEDASTASLVGPTFLMQVMEWREAIESLSHSEESDEAAALEDLLEDAQGQMQEVMEQLDFAFREENLDQALELSAQLQYWHRITETIQAKL